MATLRCPSCRCEAPATAQRFRCTCGDLFDVEHNLQPLSKELFDARLGARQLPERSGVWRFRELVYRRFPTEAIVSLQEGNTPLYGSRPISEYAGVEHLHLKHEGHNPTGSFKDRGMTVAVSRARANGAHWLGCASTGNTAASLAAYAAAAGLRALIAVPEGGTALGKLAQAIAYGARAALVRGDFDACMALLRDLADQEALYAVNSLNPFRIEGQKTIVFELIQDLGWRPPDWIVFPAGNLGNCAAFGKALHEMRACELIRSTPRLAAVQARGAAPFARAFERGFDRLDPVPAETLASAIRIGNPVSYERAKRAITGTGGIVTSVGDEEILDAKARIDAAGIGAEPASCAAVAGLKQLVDQGLIQPWDEVVCILTGHILKDSELALAYHRRQLQDMACTYANQPVVVDADPKALRALLEKE